MEGEIGFNGIIPTSARLGLGFGVGGHSWIKAVNQNGAVDLFSYGQNKNPEDYRIDPSVSGSVIADPLTGQLSASGGLYSNIVEKPVTGSYWEVKGSAGASPVLWPRWWRLKSMFLISTIGGITPNEIPE